MPEMERGAAKGKGRGKGGSKGAKRSGGIIGQIDMGAARRGALKIIATHKVTDKETWTHLSLKYYGHTTEEYWRVIYEANKELVGGDYKKLRPGMEIKIPELPKELQEDDRVPAGMIAVHKVTDKETWTHLSLKYYGHTTEEYWRVIYEANKKLVGDDYKKLRPGMELNIPKLPEHLKK